MASSSGGGVVSGASNGAPSSSGGYRPGGGGGTDEFAAVGAADDAGGAVPPDGPGLLPPPTSSRRPVRADRFFGGPIRGQATKAGDLPRRNSSRVPILSRPPRGTPMPFFIGTERPHGGASVGWTPSSGAGSTISSSSRRLTARRNGSGASMVTTGTTTSWLDRTTRGTSSSASPQGALRWSSGRTSSRSLGRPPSRRLSRGGCYSSPSRGVAARCRLRRSTAARAITGLPPEQGRGRASAPAHSLQAGLRYGWRATSTWWTRRSRGVGRP